MPEQGSGEEQRLFVDHVRRRRTLPLTMSLLCRHDGMDPYSVQPQKGPNLLSIIRRTPRPQRGQTEGGRRQS